IIKKTGRQIRGTKRPHRQKQKSGFIQAPEFLNEEIRRASEQTSPQVARAAGHPARRDEDGGSDSGSSLIRRFHFWGLNLGHVSARNGEEAQRGAQVQR
ncbi:MAG: hypothetical protein AAGF13_10850, partial [Pseudomonadota bacterium]